MKATTKRESKNKNAKKDSANASVSSEQTLSNGMAKVKQILESVRESCQNEDEYNPWELIEKLVNAVGLLAVMTSGLMKEKEKK